MRTSLLASLLLSAALIQPVFAQNAQAGRFYEEALKLYEAKQVDNAIIQLKNALQQDRNFLPALILLGKTSMEVSNPGAAEGAFEEALRLGASRSEIAVPLARSLAMQGRHSMLLTDARLQPTDLPPRTLSELLLVRANSQLALNSDRDALRSIEQARAASPGLAEAWYAEVSLRLKSGEFELAHKAADKALQLAPEDADANYQKGSIHHMQGRLDAALKSYAAVLARNPDHLEALVVRVGIFLDQDRLDAATEDLKRIRVRFPNEPRAEYLSALLADRRGDRGKAQAALRRVTELMGAVPIESLRYRPQILLLTGLSFHGLNETQKAKPYLEMLVRQQSKNPAAKVLARILYDEGQVANGIQLLEEYLKAQPGDTQALALLASGHSLQGRDSKAMQLVQQALSVQDRPELRTVLGESLLRQGRFAEAQPELENAWRRAPNNEATGQALARVYLQTRQPAKAVAVAKSLLQAQPGNLAHLNLLGTAQAAAGDMKAARATYEQGLKTDPRSRSLRASVARLDVAERRFDEAEKRYLALHSEDEKSVDVMLELASLARLRRQPDAAERWLEKAATVAAPRELRPQFALIELQLSQQKHAAALETARALLTKAPDDGNAMLIHARALLANDQPSAARPVLVSASRKFSFDAGPLIEIGAMQLEAQDLPAALHTLGKALEGRPDDPRSLVLLATADLRMGELKRAERSSRRVLELAPKQATSHLLAADLALARNQPDAALAALRHAHQVEPSTATAMRLIQHLARFDRSATAVPQTAEAWLRRSPADVEVRRALGDWQAATGRYAAAKQSYEQVLKQRPQDAPTLNNAANVLLRLKEIQPALDLAQRAAKAAPADANVLDTLAWAQHLNGQSEQALSLLRDIRLRRPELGESRYHLAAVLHKLGRRNEARTEILALLENPRGLESVKEARELATTLR